MNDARAIRSSGKKQGPRTPGHGNLPLKRVLIFFALLAAVLLLALGAAQGLKHLWNLENPDRAALNAGPFPAPRLEAAPQPELAAYLKEKQRIADSYAWVDRRKGIIRIPVEAAIDVLAQQERGPEEEVTP